MFHAWTHRAVVKKAGPAFALALALAFGARAARADEPVKSRLDAVRSRGILRVGTTGDYRPFSFLKPGAGEFEGIDIEMARALARSLGVRIVFVRTSWPDLMADVQADKFDLAVGGISINPERRKAAFFSIPYLEDGKAAVARCADRAKYQSLQDIDRPGVRVATNPGGTNEKFDRATLKRATILVHPDNRTIWRQLLDGGADVMITDASEARFWEKEHAGLCAIHPERTFDSSAKAYLLPRDPAWKAYVDAWLRGQIESKSFQEIADRWGLR